MLRLAYVLALGLGGSDDSCTSDLDCNLLGKCTDGMCVCDPGWTGSPSCGVLNLGAVDKADRPGFHNATSATWGASPVLGTDGRWHIFAAQMAKHCGIFQAWMTNSFIARAVSTTGGVGGPYAFERVVVPTFAHNPQIRKVDDGWVIFMIGGWPEEPCHCRFPLDGTKCPRPKAARQGDGHGSGGIGIGIGIGGGLGGGGGGCICGNWSKADCPSAMPGPTGDCCGPVNGPMNSGCGLATAHSMTLEGPWTVAPLTITDQWKSKNVYCAHTNPSAVQLPNRSVIMAFNAGCCDPECSETIGTAISADGWRGPWRLLSDNAILPGAHGCEDPFLWRSQRGYHMLLHNFQGPQGPSAMAFSVDGRKWHLGAETPFNCTLTFTDGSAPAEIQGCGNRPQLAWRPGTEGGPNPVPIGLFNGAQNHKPDSGKGEYTLFRPVLP